MTKIYPKVTLRPKALGLLVTTPVEERDKLAFDVEIKRESVKGFTAIARCEAGEFFPKATYEETDRKMIKREYDFPQPIKGDNEK